MLTARVYASPDGGGTDDMAAHVRGWQQLAEQRGADLAAARQANDRMVEQFTEMQSRLEALEAQRLSGEPEPEPFPRIDSNNPPRRSASAPPPPTSAKEVIDSLRGLEWPEDLQRLMVRRVP